MKKEKHHIIPKHNGGSNDPSNLVYLSVADHAAAHKKLYEEHGSKWDYIAWKSRTSQIGRDEIMTEVYREAGRKGRKMSRGTLGYKYTDEQKANMSKNHADITGDKNPMYGKKHSAETIEKMRTAAIRRRAI